MSGEDDSKPQEQSLVTPPTTHEPSGAGSTAVNTLNSQDSASSHETDTPTPECIGTHINPASLETQRDEEGVGNGINGGDAVDLEGKIQDSILELPEGQETLQLIKEEEEPLLVTSNQEIELLEQGPEAVGEEIQDWAQDESKRVKVYELIGTRWVDQGTAFCGCQFLEDSHDAYIVARSERNYDEIILSTVIRGSDVYQRQQDTLIVWTEPDGVDYALSFQDPEGCAEIWSFINDVQSHINNRDEQSTVGSSPHLGPESSVTAASILRSGHLPRPSLGIIGDIERAIKTLARTQTVKERMCEYIQQENYIKGLIEVMNTAEDLESIENLHALCSLMQTILTLNDHSMYEHILEDDMFFGVVGMLEYDQEFPNHKANYRQFLHQTSRFHQPITIQDLSIQKKIHHTYRLQFLKDVVLARVLDDSTFNVLNSCIIFNQIDIINHIQQDQTFLREIVALFVDEEMLSGGNPKKSNGQPPIASIAGEGEDLDAMQVDSKTSSSPKTNGTTPLTNGHSQPPTSKRKPGAYSFGPPENMTEEDIALRKEVILLIQQLCVMGKNVQLAARIQLFRCLVDRGILFAVQWALGLPERESDNKTLISAAGEVLITLLDHDLNGVRGHVLKQVVAIEKERAMGKRGSKEAETILEMTCRLLASSRDLAVQSHLGDALKIWMDVPQTDGPTPAGEAMGPSKPALRKDDPGTERFMEYFYKECARILFRPFFDLPEWRNLEGSVLPLSAEETNRFVYLCDLFYNFLAQHHHRSHFYFMSSHVSLRLPSLFKARDKHLRHASFRIFRLLLKQNNGNVHQLIIKHGILQPILDLTLRESRRDNLLSCSCQEYFDSMRRDNIKSLAKVCMAEHEDKIRTLAKSPLGGSRFDQFIAWYSWEMIQANREPAIETTGPESVVETRKWPSGRRMDAEEEDYFNGDDDEDDFVMVNAPTSPLLPSVSGITGSLPSFGSLKRKRRSSIGSGARPPLRTPVLNTLVDYGDEEDEDDRPPLPIAKRTSPDIPPASPRLLNKTTPSVEPPPSHSLKHDDEDDMMEAIARSNSRPESPGPGMMASSESLRPGDKRRRNDDEDDELLARVSKSKRPDLGNQRDKPAGQTKKNADDQLKKLKVNIGKTSLGLASSPQVSPSDPGTKDGDIG